MSNQPQIPFEKIDLIPHRLDVWRAALDALIAMAPGSTDDVAYHLDSARTATLLCRDFSAASDGEGRLIDRLMLLSAGRLMGTSADRATPALRTAHRTASQVSELPLLQTPRQASGGFVAAPGESALAAQPLLPGEVLLEPAHSPALPVSPVGRS